LAEAILYLKENPRCAAAFGENGRRTVETRFDQAVVLKQFTAELAALARNGN
jgi:hypothetical protein